MTISSRIPRRHVGVRVAGLVGGAEQSPGQQRAARPSGTELIGRRRAGSQATPPGDSQQQRPSRAERTAIGGVAITSVVTQPIRSPQHGRLAGADGKSPRVSSAQSQDTQSVRAQLGRTAQGDSYFSLHALPAGVPAQVPLPEPRPLRPSRPSPHRQVADVADSFQGESRRPAGDPSVTSCLAEQRATPTNATISRTAWKKQMV